MHLPARLVFALLALVPAAAAQSKGFVDAYGTVAFASVTTGPFAGSLAGATVHLHYQVALPGQVLAPGQYENYPVNAALSFLQIGAVSMAFKAGGEPLGLQNDFPVADGVHQFITQLATTGHWMEFECFDGSGGQIFGSPDYENEAGFVDPALFQLVDWNLNVGAGTIAMQLDSLVLHPVSNVGTWLLDGQGLAGTGGKAPRLVGAGNLSAGSVVQLRLDRAAPLAAATLVVGFSALNAPFKGGVLVPSADVLIVGLATDGTGQLVMPATWPSGLPAGFSLWYQAWVSDALGPKGLAASNGLHSTTP